MSAERVLKVRRLTGLTQQEFAKILNVSSGTVAMWEMGKRNPTEKSLRKLKRFMEDPIDYVIGSSNVEPELKIEVLPYLEKLKSRNREEIIYSCREFDIVLIKK
jgi:transcriptional regulator with XRE-family HTH domain